MRDTARIEPLLYKLLVYWLKTPDQRLGQLLENLARPGLLWNLEDDELHERIDLELKKIRDKQMEALSELTRLSQEGGEYE